MEFSANLGFLWRDLPLPDAIHAAKSAGFNAVECHWPYDIPSTEVSKALRATGLKMLGLNTRIGNVESGEFGLAAIIGREVEAKATIEEAIEYAKEIGALNVHVMAGLTKEKNARETFLSNLCFACEKAKQNDIGILIEPLNKYDAPGYFLQNTTQAIELINDVNYQNIKLLFDCYHVQLMEGNLTNRLKETLHLIGHIQFASVPDRSAPGAGEVNYKNLFATIKKMGWTQPLGAEYIPEGDTEETLTWLKEASAV